MQAASEGGVSGGSLHRSMVPHRRSRASRCSFISKRCTPQSVAYSGNRQSLEDDSFHQYRLIAFSKAFIILGTSTVLIPWLQLPLTYHTNRAKGDARALEVSRDREDVQPPMSDSLPVSVSRPRSAKLIPDGRWRVYPGSVKVSI